MLLNYGDQLPAFVILNAVKNLVLQHLKTTFPTATESREKVEAISKTTL